MKKFVFPTILLVVACISGFAMYQTFDKSRSAQSGVTIFFGFLTGGLCFGAVMTYDDESKRELKTTKKDDK